MKDKNFFFKFWALLLTEFNSAWYKASGIEHSVRIKFWWRNHKAREITCLV